MNMKGFGFVDYSKLETPPGYKCCKCGVSGCKLWRNNQIFLSSLNLICAKCASKEQKKDISTIDAQGRCKSKSEYGHTDKIGCRVPAIPKEKGNTFWSYLSVPPAGYTWWIKLPTLLN